MPSHPVRPVLILVMAMVGGAISGLFFGSVPSLQAQTASPLTIQPDTGRVGIGTAIPGAKLDVTGDVKAGAFLASRYPRVVGFLDTEGSVTLTGASAAWLAVPYTNATNRTEISVTVEAPSDIYLVTFSYRVQATTGSYKWSGVRIVNSVGSTAKFVLGDGSNLAKTDFGASGSIFITGLTAATYIFRLEDWASSAEDRTFVYNRQLMVYRVL